jgi:hypothetical protein
MSHLSSVYVCRERESYVFRDIATCDRHGRWCSLKGLETSKGPNYRF